MWFWVGILRITFEFVAAHAALGQVRLLSYPAIMEKHNMAQVMCVCQLKLSFKHCNTNEVKFASYIILFSLHFCKENTHMKHKVLIQTTYIALIISGTCIHI